MKKIEAIIRKSNFDKVRDALHSVEVNFFSYWDVTGVGNEKQRAADGKPKPQCRTPIISKHACERPTTAFKTAW